MSKHLVSLIMLKFCSTVSRSTRTEGGGGGIKSGCVKQLAYLGILNFCFAVNELEF